jgi:prepilin-type N-terminal cleavage/methylation domain-containing protein
MKRFIPRSRLSKLSSFTLVELLVVMGIIAILASVTLNIGVVAINAARRAKAANMANQIQTAVLGYYGEYSVYPIPTATANSDVYFSSSDQTDWQNLAWALCGNIDVAAPTTPVTPTVANTRSITFLNLRGSDADANGIPLNPINPYISPANQYFNIAMDGNYDGILGNNGTATSVITNFAYPTMPTTNTIAQGVAIWANCNTGTGTNNNFYVHTY